MAAARKYHRVLGQLGLPFNDPFEHFQMLHDEQRATAILWHRQAQGNRWIKLNPTDPMIPEILRAHEGKQDTYITPNEFNGWRLIRLLKSLRSTYVDLDGQTDIYAVLDRLHENRLPDPSAMLYSGRGLHLYWLHDPVPAQVLPVWQLMQDELIRVLKPLGADAAAKDCTRLLRLSGTVNSKSADQVVGHVLDGHRWPFRSLANEVLGERRKSAEVRDLRARRKASDKAIKGSIYARWHMVYHDLLKISAAHGHSIPTGQRDKWLFLAGCSLSWFTHPEGIEAEISSIGRTETDLSAADFADAIQPNLKRARDAAEGKKMLWNGQSVDTRYRFRRQTLFNWLEPIIPATLLPQLRAIIPDGLATERESARQKNRDRATEGRYRTKYTLQVVRASNAEKRAQARSLRDGGASFRCIAAELAVSYETIRKWCAVGVN